MDALKRRAGASLSRQVRGVDGTPGSEPFEVRNRRGQRHPLGCDVLAWTR
jgi:hypothetical protein